MRFPVPALLLASASYFVPYEAAVAQTVPAGNTIPVVARSSSPMQTLTLAQCVEQALRSNHRRKISEFAVLMAEAQHQQALSGYWPQIDFSTRIQRSDQPINFLFPTQNVPVPAQQIAVPPTTALVTIPANAFGPGFPPSNVQLPVTSGAQAIRTQAGLVPVPQQSLKVLDRDLATGSLSGTFLVFDGGLRKGLREQTAAGIEAMQAEARRTDLEVTDSVRRMYWAAVLGHQLMELGHEVLSRMEVTLQLTKAHVTDASAKVNNSDFLSNKVIVESIRAAMAELEKNETLAQAALANNMGLSWNVSVRPADTVLPESPLSGDLEQTVAESYQFNPDWAQLEAGIRAADAALTTARSEYYPKFAITGDLHRFWNGSFTGGLSTADNRAGWTVGAGVQVPLFNGSLTHGKAQEALARIGQLKQTQLLLKDGIGLQVKSLLIQIESAQKVLKASGEALGSADANRDLNMRAYENDMGEPDKVVQSQVVAALIHAQFLKARYDALALSSQLTALIGREVTAHIGGTTTEGMP